jgi:hypothetical protein
MYRFDHAVMAVRDPEASASRLADDLGLTFLPGGRHPRWGTANMIAPFGDDYVELLGVVDRRVGAGTVLGRTLLDLSAGGDRWFSICLADDAIDATAGRLGLTVEPGGRTRTDGTEVRWRGAGIEDRGDELSLPFFIAWDVPPGLHPGAMPVEHRTPVEGIAWAEVGGDGDGLRHWLGGADVPIRVVDGPSRVLAIGLRLEGGGELVIRP